MRSAAAGEDQGYNTLKVKKPKAHTFTHSIRCAGQSTSDQIGPFGPLDHEDVRCGPARLGGRLPCHRRREAKALNSEVERKWRRPRLLLLGRGSSNRRFSSSSFSWPLTSPLWFIGCTEWPPTSNGRLGGRRTRICQARSFYGDAFAACIVRLKPEERNRRV